MAYCRGDLLFSKEVFNSVCIYFLRLIGNIDLYYEHIFVLLFGLYKEEYIFQTVFVKVFFSEIILIVFLKFFTKHDTYVAYKLIFFFFFLTSLRYIIIFSSNRQKKIKNCHYNILHEYRSRKTRSV